MTPEEAASIADAIIGDFVLGNDQPVTVAVIDGDGHLMALQKRGLVAAEIAAKTTDSLGHDADCAARALTRISRGIALRSVQPEPPIPALPGSILIRTPEGDIVGAVGIEGGCPVLTRQRATAAIRMAGYVSDPGGRSDPETTGK